MVNALEPSQTGCEAHDPEPGPEADAADSLRAFRHALIDAGLLLPSGVDGVYGWSGAFEDVVGGLARLVTAAGAAASPDRRPERVHLPPVMPRWAFERTGYLASFPDLAGSVQVFTGDDRAHTELLARLAGGHDWSEVLGPSDVVLRPAACHGLYPLCRGRLPADGRRVEVSGYCFRHEPSVDPARLQAFRMHELVYLGDPEEALSHRDSWVDRGVDLLGRLGLDVEATEANDPFFGRAGRILASAQKAELLKVEVVAQLSSADRPTALMSSNCHRDHFGVAFGIETADGAVAHSACVGFGMERVALALLDSHGLDVRRWPVGVRNRLWP